MSRDLFWNCMNGAALIHDFEIALSGNFRGRGSWLSEGKFGMATETGLFLNQIAAPNFFWNWLWGGCGKISGVTQSSPPKTPEPAFCTMPTNTYSVTIHLAIGTDIPHMHRRRMARRLVRRPTTISIVLRAGEEMHLAAYI